jgi:hypothetical protein
MVQPYHDSWWFDETALPERIVWARIRVFRRSAEVLDCDGRTHSFASESQARLFLLEDEYRSLSNLDDEDLSELGVSRSYLRPPADVPEDQLVPLLVVELRPIPDDQEPWSGRTD